MGNLKTYLIASHDEIETDPNRVLYEFDKDSDYDLLNINDRSVAQTVKGRTVIKNITEGKYKVSNLIPPKYELYKYNCSKVEKLETLGKIDFTHKEAVLKDLGLGDIKFIGKKVSVRHLALGVNNIVFDFKTDKHKFNTLSTKMGMPDEENILKMYVGDKLANTYNLGYNGRVTTIELQRKGRKYQLRLNIKSDEGGPTSNHNIDIPL